jgi:hypothetical protein
MPFARIVTDDPAAVRFLGRVEVGYQVFTDIDFTLDSVFERTDRVAAEREWLESIEARSITHMSYLPGLLPGEQELARPAVERAAAKRDEAERVEAERLAAEAARVAAEAVARAEAKAIASAAHAEAQRIAREQLVREQLAAAEAAQAEAQRLALEQAEREQTQPIETTTPTTHEPRQGGLAAAVAVAMAGKDPPGYGTVVFLPPTDTEPHFVWSRVDDYREQEHYLATYEPTPQSQTAGLVAKEIERLVAEGRPAESITTEEISRNLGIDLATAPDLSLVDPSGVASIDVLQATPIVVGGRDFDHTALEFHNGWWSWGCDTVTGLSTIDYVINVGGLAEESASYLQTAVFGSSVTPAWENRILGRRWAEYDGSVVYLSLDSSAVPEPSTAALLMSAGAAWLRRRRY